MRKLIVMVVVALVLTGCGSVTVDYYPETGEVHAKKMGVLVDTEVAGFEAVLADGAYVKWEKSTSDADADAIRAAAEGAAAGAARGLVPTP